MTPAPTLTAPALWTWQDHRIRYVVQGEGAPLILIHGFGASLGHWRHNLPVLAAAGYRVYALDLLGFGASDKPPVPYSLELWQALLQDFWREQVQHPAIFVGNSIGALLSLMVLADSPEMARGGILLNCAGGLNHRPEELHFPLRTIMGLFTQVVASPAWGPLIFNLVRRKANIRRTLRQVYCNQNAVTEELVDLLYQPSCDPGAQQVFASILTAPPGPSPRQLLPRIQQPLLVLWGEEDPWTPVTGSTPFQEAKGMPLRFMTLPKAGHCPHDEHPDTVNAYILGWLQDYCASEA